MKQFFLLVSILLLAGCRSIPDNITEEYYNIGNAYFDAGKYDKAIEYYFKALNGKTESRNSIYYNLGIALIDTGRYAQGLEQFDLLLTIDPDNITVLQADAYGYYLSGETEKALEVYDHILSLFEYDSNALYNKALIVKEKQPDVAIKLLEKLYKYSPGSDVATLLADLYMDKGQRDEAVELLEEALSSDTKNTGILERLIRFYREEKLYYKSLEYMDTILDIEGYSGIPEMLFEKSEMEFLDLDDYNAGFDSLVKALDAGFDKRDKIQELLKNDKLSHDRRLADYMKLRGFN